MLMHFLNLIFVRQQCPTLSFVLKGSLVFPVVMDDKRVLDVCSLIILTQGNGIIKGNNKVSGD